MILEQYWRDEVIVHFTLFLAQPYRLKSVSAACWGQIPLDIMGWVKLLLTQGEIQLKSFKQQYRI